MAVSGSMHGIGKKSRQRREAPSPWSPPGHLPLPLTSHSPHHSLQGYHIPTLPPPPPPGDREGGCFSSCLARGDGGTEEQRVGEVGAAKEVKMCACREI